VSMYEIRIEDIRREQKTKHDYYCNGSIL
jgi:hypothetical protein